jgi:hypothetical protein
MATFTITTTTNMTALTGRGGNDTYNVNGGNLTIDSDTRYGPNTTPSTGPFGNITLSATQGGTMTISGQNVRLIPFSSGTGTVPASGTTISRSGVTAELLCVMTLRTGGSVVASGGAMPSTGWLKVRNVSVQGTFPIGAITGINCSSTAVDTVGWIELVGVETLTVIVNRLNTFTVNGAWFSLGTTSGARGQTVQLPYFGSGVQAYPGVEIETSPGSGVYKFWANAGNLFVGSGLGTDSRARLVGIDDTGLMTIGTGRDAASAGDLPVSGCDMRIPNIITSNTNSTAGYGTNVTPNATMGSRYEISTSSSGVVSLSRLTGAWYWNIQQPYSVYINDLHSCEQVVIAETSTAVIVDGLHVGSSNQATPYASNSVVFQQCLNGGTANNVSGLRAQSVSTSGYSVYFVNIYGGWTITNIRGHFASDPTALCGPIFFNTCDGVNLTNVEVVGKRLILSACSNFTINNLYYADNIKATTTSSVSSNALEVMGNSKNITFTNMYNWPGVANVHPYGGALFCNTTFDSIFSGIGTVAVPFEGGATTVNRPGYMFNDGGLNKNVKIQRNWLNNLRLGLASSTNTSQNIRMQNCYNTDASLSQGPNWYNSIVRGNRQNSGVVQISYTHVDGMHFYDSFTGDTTARAFLVFTEKSVSTASAYVVNSGTPKFTSTGSLVMQTTGDQVTWTWNYFILGWSALTTFAITGTNQVTNHTQEYDIDKGSGFSGSFKTLSNSNLASETGISPTVGFRLKLRITCTLGASTNVLTSLVVNGTTTLALQNAALYPLDTIGLTINGIQPGSDVVIYQAGTTTVLDTGDSVGATSYTYGYTTPQLVDIGVLCAGYVPYFIRNYQLTTTPTSLPVAQVFDRSYQ